MEADERTIKTIRGGTMVHVNGIPVVLVGDHQFSTHDNNWPLIGTEATSGVVSVYSPEMDACKSSSMERV